MNLGHYKLIVAAWCWARCSLQAWQTDADPVLAHFPTVLSYVCMSFSNYVGSSFPPAHDGLQGLKPELSTLGLASPWQWESCILLSLNLFPFFFSVGSTSRCPSVRGCLLSRYWCSTYFWPFSDRQLRFIFPPYSLLTFHAIIYKTFLHNLWHICFCRT